MAWQNHTAVPVPLTGDLDVETTANPSPVQHSTGTPREHHYQSPVSELVVYRFGRLVIGFDGLRWGMAYHISADKSQAWMLT